MRHAGLVYVAFAYMFTPRPFTLTLIYYAHGLRLLFTPRRPYCYRCLLVDDLPATLFVDGLFATFVCRHLITPLFTRAICLRPRLSIDLLYGCLLIR